MSKFLKSAISPLALVSALWLASCSHETPFAGTWKSAAPADVTTEIPGCRNAMSTLSVSFAPDANNTDGTVQINDELAIVRPLAPVNQPGEEPVYANVKGYGTVKGTWSRDVDDDDDLLLNLDYSTLSVTVDPATITFTGAAADSFPAEKIDSIANAVKTEMDIYLRSKLSMFNVLSDVEVKNDHKVLEFETHSPEIEYKLLNVDR